MGGVDVPITSAMTAVKSQELNAANEIAKSYSFTLNWNTLLILTQTRKAGANLLGIVEQGTRERKYDTNTRPIRDQYETKSMRFQLSETSDDRSCLDEQMAWNFPPQVSGQSNQRRNESISYSE